ADPEITEWYSVAEIQEKFGITLASIYGLASTNAIPKKKEGRMVYYSKKHFDIAKGAAQPKEPQYYTVAEAMEKFNLTRDQLYHYATYHNIPRVKVGKYTKISRPELDKLLGAPQIE
ncbi:MAG: helix-turn-helix domain-containing protein, partial [Mediterranea sp.]|nr:helix-turn-helix domain-containing protein [Mediterranea sp.]